MRGKCFNCWIRKHREWWDVRERPSQFSKRGILIFSCKKKKIDLLEVLHFWIKKPNESEDGVRTPAQLWDRMPVRKKTPGPCQALWKPCGPYEKRLPKRTMSCLLKWSVVPLREKTGFQTTCPEPVRWRHVSTWKKYLEEHRGLEVHGDGVSEVGAEC